jgi:uncharacterized membrane protein YobD (UPF0266 family)
VVVHAVDVVENDIRVVDTRERKLMLGVCPERGSPVEGCLRHAVDVVENYIRVVDTRERKLLLGMSMSPERGSPVERCVRHLVAVHDSL